MSVSDTSINYICFAGLCTQYDTNHKSKNSNCKLIILIIVFLIQTVLPPYIIENQANRQVF